MNGSLFSLIASQHPNHVVPMRSALPLSNRLYRYFEDLVVENRTAALVVQGRCPDGAAGVERQRFLKLATSARRIYLFSCDRSCSLRTWSVPSRANSRVFSTTGFHDLDSGPFLVVADPRFTGVIASRRVEDREVSGEAFDTIWSFEPNVVYTALEYLRARVAAEWREYEPEFAQWTSESAPTQTSLRLTLDFTTRLARLLQRQTEIETTINRVSSAINSTLDLEMIYHTVVDQIGRTLGARRAALAVWGERESVPERVVEAHFDAHGGPAESGEPPDPIEVPVVSRGRSIGVLTVEDDSPLRVWEEEEVFMVRTLADHLAMGIANARLFRRVEEQAFTDEMTGLFNRRYFVERMDREVRLANRTGQSVSILLLDLDHLKRINDTHGHSAGDRTLREVAACLRRAVRDVDVCARCGGDEFAVILPGTDREGAVVVAERLRRSLAATEVPGVGRVTASLGVGTYPSEALAASELIDAADRALYAAKHAGRDRVE